ncbi:MAG: alcohol dehydrogenase catalytic domain-containing protein [Eubacterium sp.]|nr:alcohol dehydrogenase catalytic domain-containing protein [Eubacterium sp.]
MLNAVYRLVAPRRIEIEFSDIDLRNENVIVRPTYLSVCNADQRYYQGTRGEEVLKEKLPMALIHEGIGEVLHDSKGEFKPGELVVMIPNTPEELNEDGQIIGENYRRTSKFRASGFDGFMQDVVEIRRDRILRLPPDIDRHVAAFTEIVSVSVHALSRFDKIAHERRDAVGIWGDGNLGFITALFFHVMFPDTKLYVFGLNRDKLSDFSFADDTFLVNKIPESLKIDHGFECVGGEGAPKAINQIIDYINPEGTISILGVSENPVAINTRMILEKGLRVFGSSRSGRVDFMKTIELYKSHPELVDYLKNIVGAVVKVRTIDDMKRAFELDSQTNFGKTIMEWMHFDK